MSENFRGGDFLTHVIVCRLRVRLNHIHVCICPLACSGDLHFSAITTSDFDRNFRCKIKNPYTDVDVKSATDSIIRRDQSFPTGSLLAASASLLWKLKPPIFAVTPSSIQSVFKIFKPTSTVRSKFPIKWLIIIKDPTISNALLYALPYEIVYPGIIVCSS